MFRSVVTGYRGHDARIHLNLIRNEIRVREILHVDLHRREQVVEEYTVVELD